MYHTENENLFSIGRKVIYQKKKVTSLFLHFIIILLWTYDYFVFVFSCLYHLLVAIAIAHNNYSNAIFFLLLFYFGMRVYSISCVMNVNKFLLNSIVNYRTPIRNPIYSHWTVLPLKILEMFSLFSFSIHSFVCFTFYIGHNKSTIQFVVVHLKFKKKKKEKTKLMIGCCWPFN